MKKTILPGNCRSFIARTRRTASEALGNFFREELGWEPQKTIIALVFIIAAIIAVKIWLPPYRFDQPLSTVVFDRKGELLGARIAGDGQWRFPAEPEVAEKFKTCLLHFEDQHYYHHPGFNPLSIARASFQNIMAGKIVSGGSTITMQLKGFQEMGRNGTFARS